MVTDRPAVPTIAALGHRLVMVGASAFTSSVTATVWVLFALGTSRAVMVIFPE
ncbi:MAG: hypothetical protein ABSF12_04990 [Bryobacteraceae bacterium]